MSNQVGDCFKFLWPFHNVRTLKRTNFNRPFYLLLDQGFFWWHGVLILLASRKRWSTRPLLTASKRPSPVFKKSSRLTAPTKLNKAMLKTCWGPLQELETSVSGLSFVQLLPVLIFLVKTPDDKEKNKQTNDTRRRTKNVIWK